MLIISDLVKILLYLKESNLATQQGHICTIDSYFTLILLPHSLIPRGALHCSPSTTKGWFYLPSVSSQMYPHLPKGQNGLGLTWLLPSKQGEEAVILSSTQTSQCSTSQRPRRN